MTGHMTQREIYIRLRDPSGKHKDVVNSHLVWDADRFLSAQHQQYSGTIRTRDPENARQNNAAYMQRARLANPEKFRARDRDSSKKKRALSPEKVAARHAVNNAVKRGDLVKPQACESCGQEKRLTGHHDDYTKPLSVRWLCYGCHGKEHRVIEFRRANA